MQTLTPWKTLTSNIKESHNADKVAEISRDDVYKQLGGEKLRWVIILILLGSMFTLVYLNGYYSYEPKTITKTDTRTVREVRILKADGTRSLPKTGAGGIITYPAH